MSLSSADFRAMLASLQEARSDEFAYPEDALSIEVRILRDLVETLSNGWGTVLNPHNSEERRAARAMIEAYEDLL